MIGVIADDFTGATDVAAAFRHAGLRTFIVFNTSRTSVLPDADATIIALKTRTTPVEEAVAQSLTALAWLRDRGASQIFFKYCSTFDSRPQGNIGPVADALLAELHTARTVFVPASPRHLRTQYMGHLFVDRVLLSDSPMRFHPLTPMKQSYLPTILAQQTKHPVGLIDYHDVRQGARNVARRLTRNETEPYVLIDAVCPDDLRTIATACIDDVLVTGAAGLAAGLAAAHMQRLGRRSPGAHGEPVRHTPPGVVLAGSCSARTLEQIDHMKREGHPTLQLDPALAPETETLARAALHWYDQQDPNAGPLIYSSLPPIELHRSQEVLGVQSAADVVEKAMGSIARGLVDRGVSRLIVAGGETSGAVVVALGVGGGSVGAEEAPGVPWIEVEGPQALSLLLKSGNFGDPQMLARAVART